MRPIEFRYRFKNRKTNQLITQVMDISSIENRAFWPNPFGSLEWGILSRDEFTGLLDKNGKKIFEGDIVKSSLRMPGEEIYEVKWAEKSAEFSIQRKDVCIEHVEVIGNIYENQDLLK